ncbi:MAG TPA: cytochrome c3 family protein [Phycisphaerae bacterium]|nr:cytochrome c3 family protein [Phycisphaerae bacterium]
MPCLRSCGRPGEEQIAREFAQKVGPDVVILDELEDLFLPVPFDHKGHAEMAEMTNGCRVCHHYTPEGMTHPACKSCHEKALVRDDMRKPALKGAYHRQCMSCHREWAGNDKCAWCHPPKTGSRGPNHTAQRAPTVHDILGTMHPPIPEPDTEIYQPSVKPSVGTHVIFRHKDHIHRFGLKCAECHQEDNCGRCHEEGRKHEQRRRTLADHHRPCDRCHAEDVAEGGRCKYCHWTEGEPRPPTFDHATTGWPLSRYHLDKSCRGCHKTVPYRKLDRDCNKCHGGWDPDTFDHAVTGQALNETHAEIDCGDCHAGRKFDRPPTCEECHDPDDGITFPAKRPGPALGTKSPE